MNTTLVPELLSPAGDSERLESAVLFGADAVYLGGKMFGMRATPSNFDYNELKDAVEFCHDRGVKAYLTCNVLPTNSEAELLPEYLKYVSEIGVDALIIADIGVLMTAKRVAPEMEIHISTQAGVVNFLSAREFYAMGASRVVLARELSLDDVKTIRDKTPPELCIEAFVHGAMCMSFSGRCLISQYMVGRDANHGECAQPCRWNYSLMEEKRPGQYFPVFEADGGSYILNAQDLCMIRHIDKLAAAGIGSFKIEGRAKSAYYVAVVTNAYRLAIDMYKKNPENFSVPEWLAEELLKVSHRQYSTGFYFKENPPEQYYESGGYVRDWDVVATVERYEDGKMVCMERNRFAADDELELLMPGYEPERLIPGEMYNQDGESINIAYQPMTPVIIPYNKSVPAGSFIRKKR